MKALVSLQPFQHWLQRAPRTTTTPEDSALLRIAVQSLVTVGILATDIAATTTNGFWAIPLSLVGALWSWRCRRRRNLVAKFGIAVGMLVVLGLFLSRLLSNPGDTRLVLAELLIQLQVLHTFDLPRRKDLGYSAVIGLILMAVAGTISETMAFGGFLVIFLAIALITLLLDYRSRLGLQTLNLRSLRVSRHPLAQPLAKQWAKQGAFWFAGVLTLGLLVFALTPRVPGYQFRTLPVSGEVNIQGTFNPQQILNPGYPQGRRGMEGRGMTRGGVGQGGTGENFSSRFYAGFNTEMNQNLRGALVPEVVMRVRSQAEGFWRMMAFDEYTGQGWKVSQNESAQVLRRNAWSYKFWVPPHQPQRLTKPVVQTYSIQTQFPNLLPTLNQAREVYFPSREIGVDKEGSLRAPGELDQGLTYTVISDVPYRDRTQLNQAAPKYSKSITQRYLQVPTKIQPSVRQATEKLLAKAGRPLTTPYEKALYLAQAVKQNYTLQTDIPVLATQEDLATHFLFEWEGGYADHFSTVLTIMLRSIGIPARLVTGFAPGQFNAFTGLYIVKNTDAYALTEVYFPRNGWFAFDPIPGHDLYPPSVEQGQTFTVLRQFWNWIASWLPSPVMGWLNEGLALLTGVAQRVLTVLSSGLGGVLSLTLLIVGASVLGWGGWNLAKVWRHRQRLRKLPAMERIYQQMLSFLAEEGLQKQVSETPLEYLHQVQLSYPSAQSVQVAKVTNAYLQWRYGGKSVDTAEVQRQWLLLKRSRSIR
jgi:protein-glutamine gamma-glutamyltransferase